MAGQKTIYNDSILQFLAIIVITSTEQNISDFVHTIGV